MKDSDIHHYHHNEPPQPIVSVKVERNTKGYNYEISISGAHSVNEAIDLVDKAYHKMDERFGLGGSFT